MCDVARQKPVPIEAVHTIEAFSFVDGTVLDLRLAYWTLGELNAQGSNVMLLSHGASGDRNWALPHCRSGGAFDPLGRFVVSVDLPGGGDSSRRRNSSTFPARYALRDLTNALTALLDALGAARNVLFSGPSVSSLIGLDLAATRPDLFGAMSLWNCGVRCDGYAQGIIEAVASVLALDSGPDGMRAAVRCLYPSLVGRDGLATSDATERDQTVNRIAEDWIERWRSDEIAARYLCTIGGDVAALHGGELALASKIRCPILWLPCSSDQILPPSAIATFAERVPTGRIAICQSDRGHVSTGASEGSSEFAFYDNFTANFYRDAT